MIIIMIRPRIVRCYNLLPLGDEEAEHDEDTAHVGKKAKTGAKAQAKDGAPKAQVKNDADAGRLQLLERLAVMQKDQDEADGDE